MVKIKSDDFNSISEVVIDVSDIADPEDSVAVINKDETNKNYEYIDTWLVDSD